jgi:hypothetical protein
MDPISNSEQTIPNTEQTVGNDKKSSDIMDIFDCFSFIEGFDDKTYGESCYSVLNGSKLFVEKLSQKFNEEKSSDSDSDEKRDIDPEFDERIYYHIKLIDSYLDRFSNNNKGKKTKNSELLACLLNRFSSLYTQKTKEGMTEDEIDKQLEESVEIVQKELEEDIKSYEKIQEEIIQREKERQIRQEIREKQEKERQEIREKQEKERQEIREKQALERQELIRRDLENKQKEYEEKIISIISNKINEHLGQTLFK